MPSTDSRFKMRPLTAALLAALGAPPFHAARGDEPANTAATTPVLPEVEVRGQGATDDYNPGITTIGKQPTPIRDVPQSVTVVNRAVLDAQAAASLQDALRTVPGITISAAEGGTIGNNINLRGFTARTDIYLDGFRDRGQYYRDTFYLESIEVLKGPSSMLFGRGSTGGVINQVSKVPLLDDRNEVSATVGTSDHYRTTADVNRQLSDTSAMRVNLMAQSVSTTRDVMKNEDYGVAPSLRFGVGTPTEITFSGLFEHNRDMPDYGILPVNGRPAEVRPDNYYGFTEDRTIQDTAIVGARVEHRFSPTLTLRNQTQFSRYVTDARETSPNAVGTFDGTTFTPLSSANGNPTNEPLDQLFLRYVSHDREIHDTSIYNQTDLFSQFDTGPVKHRLLTGVEIGRDKYRNQSFSRTPTPLAILPLVDPPRVDNPPGTVSTPGNQANTTADTFAVYASDTLELGPRWKLIGGLRWDRYAAHITNSVNSSNTSGSTAPASADQTVSYTSVRTGAIYQPSDTQSYYVSFGTSFNPSFETLAVSNGTQDLPPEKSRSFEIGAKWDLYGGYLSLTSALFQVEKTNARSQISPGVFTLDGNVRVNGFELGAAGRITSRWQVFGGYTLLDAEIVKASALDRTEGKVPANTPRHSIALWTTYRVARDWEVGGGATYLSNRFANNTNVVSIGDFTRWDATVAYRQPSYDLRFNLLNVFDQRDFVAAIQSDGGRAIPGIGRTALVTWAYRFR